MKIIDTSSWIPALRRKGDAEIRERVKFLLDTGQAALCPPVRVELWAGMGGDHERSVLRMYEQSLPEYPITDEVWQAACDLGDRGRRKGIRIPAMDLLIAACARHHQVGLEAVDKHFDLIAQL